MSKTPIHIIFDMDGTLLSIECLDAIVETALTAQLQPEAVKEAMAEVDRQMALGMEGGALLEETIPARLHVARDMGAPVTPEHFEIVAHMVESTLTPSIVDALSHECEVANADSIAISVVSGGPQECVDMAVAQLETRIPHIHGAKPHFNGYGNTIRVTPDGSFDREQSHIYNSKVETIRSFVDDPARAIMIGDGSTDYEVYDVGVVNYFIGVGFWSRRPYIFDKEENLPYFAKVDDHSAFAPALHNALHHAQR